MEFSLKNLSRKSTLSSGKIILANRNRNEVDNYIYEVCESTWHEGSTKDEQQDDKTLKVKSDRDD